MYVDWSREVGERDKHMDDIVAKVDIVGGLIIGGDMMVGRPCNIAIAKASDPNIEVITAPNLIKLLTMRDGTDMMAPPVAAEKTGRTRT